MNLILFKKFLVKFWSTWYSFIQCAVKKWSIWLYKLYLTFTDYQILEVLVYSSVQFMSHFYLWRKMGKGRHRFSRVKNFLTSYTDIWKYWSNLFTYTNPPDGRVSVTRESKRQKKREKLNQKSGTSFERREKYYSWFEHSIYSGKVIISVFQTEKCWPINIEMIFCSILIQGLI